MLFRSKMKKYYKLAEDEQTNKQAILDAALLIEQQYQAKRLDLVLGTGSKIQEMQKAFNKSNLQGAIAFFAADFGGFSQHSRKMFELQKAAKTAQIILNIPEAASSAMKIGWSFGGPAAPYLSAAYGAAALAQQLGNYAQSNRLVLVVGQAVAVAVYQHRVSAV